MKKRLRKKLEKLGRLPCRNVFAHHGYFFREQRVIEYYGLLKEKNPEHPLLKEGEITEDGRFRFNSKNLMPSQIVGYIEKLAGVL